MELTAFAGSVPANYDKYLGPFLFEPFALDIVKRLSNRKVKNVLELACGTGRVTKHLLSIIPGDGQLTASDLNQDMINIAKERVQEKKVQWQVIDAQELPFTDNSFDTIVCQFGVMFFPDKAKAFREANRVLQEGGLFLFNTWDSIDKNPLTTLIDEVLNEEFSNAAPNFLEEGPFSFHDQNVIKQLLQQAAFRNILLETVSIRGSYANPEDVVRRFVDGSPLAAFLNEHDSAVQQRVKRKIQDAVFSRFGSANNDVPLQAIVCEAIN